MARRLATVALALSVSAALAGSSPAVDVSVLQNTPERIVVRYDFNQFTQRWVEWQGQRYLNMRIPHEPQLLEMGAPAVPYVVRSLAIPEGAQVTVRLLDARYEDYQGITLISSKGNLSRSIDPETVPYSFGAAYTRDAFFPGKLSEARATYIMRDVQGVPVAVFPVQNNPVTGTLRVYSSMTIEVRTHGVASPAAAPPAQVPRRLSKAFYDLYKLHFINYDPEGRYQPLDETGNMLVICHDPWMPNMAPFVNHKNSIGINTTVVGVSTIGNNATSIKNYIQNVYNTSDLAFVLLVGDGAQVAYPTASGGASDPSYAKLAGGDDYPEIMVGRFSAENPGHVDLQVLKTVEYEQNQAVLTEWFWKGVGIASAEGAGIGDDGEADWQHMDLIRQWLLGAGYTHVDQIYDTNGGTAQMVTNALNAGRGIINYCGHGWNQGWATTGFSNSHVDALVNYNMLPFIVSVACYGGSFPGETCFGEAWLRATQGGEPTGAVGAYMSSISQSWAPPMEAQDEFNLLLTNPDHPYHYYGTLCYAGSCSMMDKYGSGGVSMFNTWILFGDPSLKIIGTTAPPQGLGVSPGTGLNSQGQQGGPFTPDSKVYTLHNYDPTPINYTVTKTVNWLTVTNASGTIPPGGDVLVTVSINALANVLPKGFYTDTVTFTNTTSHIGDTTRQVTLKVGVPTKLYEWKFDSSPGWNISGGQWAFGKPTGQGGTQHGYPDPTSGYTGTNVYGVNLNGDYSTAVGGPYYLTTGPIDLSDTTEITLKFRRWLNTDYQPYVYATIHVSSNGSTWTQIWSNGSSEIAENSWSLQEYDISSYAANKPTVYIRWGYQIGSGAWAYSGWNIDDVEIWGLKAGPQFPIGDLNCDGVVNFGDINPFVLAISDPQGYAQQYPNCNIMLADCNGDGFVDFNDINPFVALLTGGDQ